MCDSWTIRKGECWRIHVFELCCWRRLLRVPWTARWSNQSIRKEINPEYSLEGLMLKLQHFGHLMWRANSLEKTEGRSREGDRGWDCWMASPIQWTWTGANSREAWHAAVHGSESQDRTWQLNNNNNSQCLITCWTGSQWSLIIATLPASPFWVPHYLCKLRYWCHYRFLVRGRTKT